MKNGSYRTQIDSANSVLHPLHYAEKVMRRAAKHRGVHSCFVYGTRRLGLDVRPDSDVDVAIGVCSVPAICSVVHMLLSRTTVGLAYETQVVKTFTPAKPWLTVAAEAQPTVHITVLPCAWANRMSREYDKAVDALCWYPELGARFEELRATARGTPRYSAAKLAAYRSLGITVGEAGLAEVRKGWALAGIPPSHLTTVSDLIASNA